MITVNMLEAKTSLSQLAAYVERLPLLDSDPFDRLMLAQAIIEGLQLVTYDRHLSRYDDPIPSWS